ncbi:MAG: ABC transporter substrate-binding protein [Treponema sp.]|nr:ABC transporter substrate-binding protein [Treponema sp.]
MKIILLLCLLLPGLLHARGERQAGDSSIGLSSDISFYGLRGSSSVGLIRLFEEPPQIDNFNFNVEALANQDLMAGRLIRGEATFGVLPPNMAAKIASEGVDIRAVAVIGTGMLRLLTTDPGIRSIADLRGKTVEVAGQGATPDFVFRHLLRFHGIDPDSDLHLGYALAPPEIAQLLIAGRISTALLPEPFATMASNGRPDLRTVSNIQEEWVRAGGTGNYPMTLLVVQGSFADSYPAVVRRVLEEARASIEWVRANPAEAGQLVQRHDLGLNAPIATAAIPNSNYVFIPAAEARPSLEALFRVFLEYDPGSIGGALPGAGFYHR